MAVMLQVEAKWRRERPDRSSLSALVACPGEGSVGRPAGVCYSRIDDPETW